MGKEPKIYELTTIAEIEQIPEGKLDDFFVDLKQWLELRKQGKALNELLKKTSHGNTIKFPDFIKWIDDGEHTVNLTITAKAKR